MLLFVSMSRRCALVADSTTMTVRREDLRVGLPIDYAERVYAGALGKVLGVYLGRPFEGWSHTRIAEQLGDITYYVHDKVGVPLVVADDDISGTFTFIRALPDHGNDSDLTPAQIGDTWLNYIIDQRSILWWGGLGRSTEHTAFLRLLDGVRAPESGSMALNGQVVAEQIGAQIFIDGWAMVAPGRPAVAADLARRAGSVSHDGEAVHAAALLAAMEAQAFVETDIDVLLDTGLSFVPDDSLIARMITDIRGWHSVEPDWHAARDLLDRDYGYHAYGGNCHIIPNHGLIILALLYGAGDWNTSMMIVNTCGWDTDCNSGNLGCLLGIRNGLSAFDGEHDWRGPVADRMYLPTADAGRAVTDVASEALRITNIGRALAGEPTEAPKNGARFHFELPGSVQGFMIATGAGTVRNVVGHSATGQRSLVVDCLQLDAPVSVTTPTFLSADAFQPGGYQLMASPTLYAGQVLRATVSADEDNSSPTGVQLIIQHNGQGAECEMVIGSAVDIDAGGSAELTWVVPSTDAPICAVGVQISGVDRSAAGPCRMYLDQLTWDGEPDVTLSRSSRSEDLNRSGWVDATDMFRRLGSQTPFDIVQNSGRGLLLHGTGEWCDYEVSVDVTPHLAKGAGVGARVQGLRRYYALLVASDGSARLVKRYDEVEQVVAQADISWVLDRTYRLSLRVEGADLIGLVDGVELLRFTDDRDGSPALATGAIALVVDEGRVLFGPVRVRPAHLSRVPLPVTE